MEITYVSCPLSPPASKLSDWNFGAMHLLLVAEKFSIMRENDKAGESHDVYQDVMCVDLSQHSLHLHIIIRA